MQAELFKGVEASVSNNSFELSKITKKDMGITLMSGGKEKQFFDFFFFFAPQGNKIWCESSGFLDVLPNILSMCW